MSKKSIPPDVFLQKCKEKFGDKFDYSKSEYYNTTVEILIICKKHGEFLKSPIGHLNSKFGCPKCSVENRNIRKFPCIDGLKFWNFTILTESPSLKRKRDGAFYKCQCSCGKIFTANRYSILNGIKRDCGKHNTRHSKNTNPPNFKITPVNDLFYFCQCFCGKEYYSLKDNINKNKISCGCNKKTKEHKLFKGYGDVSMSYFRRIKNNALSRNYEFSISIEYADKIFQDQNKKCKISGIELQQFRSKKKNWTASLDRIDSNKGYVEGNVQWVHKCVNKMKSDLTDMEFINFCKIIAKHNLGNINV